MYDDLAWVERNYGCVAEYNRCMEERYYEDYEPTEEELAEEERKMNEYHAEIKRLNGSPSEFIKKLVEEWAECKPHYKDWNTDGFYKVRDWSKARTLDIVAKVAEHYGVEVDEEWATFYRAPEGKFAISVEYNDTCYLKNKNIGNLDLKTFKDVFRDLHYARVSPCMKYGNIIRSNCSLGELLRHELKEVAE